MNGQGWLTGFFSGVDYRFLAVILAMAASLVLTWYWKRKQQQCGNDALFWAAVTVESLGLYLSYRWASEAPEDAMLAWVFVAGFVSMAIVKSPLVPIVLGKTEHTKLQRFAAGFGMFVGYIMLYMSGWFHAINASGDKAFERLEASKPALALDEQISIARSRVADLSIYADASEAKAEAEKMQAEKAESSAKIAQLKNAIQDDLSSIPKNANGKSAGKTLSSLTSNCYNTASYYYQYCSDVANNRRELSSLGVTSTAPNFQKGHAEYKGAQAHLASLLQQRAEMTVNGNGAQQVWPQDTIAISEAFGLEYNQGDRLKWLIYTFLFDLIGLMLRIVAADGVVKLQQQERHQFGFTPQPEKMPATAYQDTNIKFSYPSQNEPQAFSNPIGFTATVGGYKPGYAEKISKDTSVQNGTEEIGRKPIMKAEDECLKSEIMGAMLSGELPMNAGRDRVKKYLVGKFGQAGGNSRLSAIISDIKEEINNV